MMPAHPAPLSQDDLLRLDAFLHSPACGQEAMSLSRAHGFLTAAASGPEPLEPAEWLRLVFDEPVFESGDQADDILGMALRLYRDIEADLGATGRYRPLLEFARGPAGGVEVEAWAWCQGYLAGMSVCREEWALHTGRSMNELLSPIVRLSRHLGAIRSAPQRRLCDELPLAAESLYRYWRAREGRG
ncbi:MAG: YecA family protein [Thiobacillaceae bacterium]|jgi:uncharacterized protein|nr:YecA family protein [Thiobacillaceae bacterium]